MTQHDYNVGNQTFPATRTDLNNLFSAILSKNSGTGFPSTTVAGMEFYETDSGINWQRNAADSGWVHMWTIGKQGLVDQNGSTIYAADSVGTDAYAITLTPAVTAYAESQTFRFKAGTANTGAATLAVNGLSAITIKKNYNSDLVTGDIVANQIVEVIYDGTNFQMLSPVATASVGTVSAVTARSSNTILGSADNGGLFVCTSTFTQTFTAAATLGAKWYCFIRNDGTGVITLDPNSSETIDGVGTLKMYPGEAYMVVCDGSNFFTVGRQKGGLILLGSASPSSASAVDFTSFITSDFNAYVLKGQYVLPATDGVDAYLRFSTDGGSTFMASTQYTYQFSDWIGSTATGSGTAQIKFNRTTIGNADGEGIDFEIRFSLPSGGQANKAGMIQCFWRNTSGGLEGGNCNFIVATASAINAVRFLFSSGNISRGNLELYGVRG